MKLVGGLHKKCYSAKPKLDFIIYNLATIHFLIRDINSCLVVTMTTIHLATVSL